MAGITSLVGSGPEGIVILTAEQIGAFAPNTGVFSPFAAASPEVRDEINRLRSPVRSYDNGRLAVSEDKGAIAIKDRGEERRIAPDNAKLWQPSVSHDLKRLVYIRVDESPQ